MSRAGLERDLPWPYEKIDPQRAGEVAYDSWFERGCCYAAASGVILPLRETVGAPYTDLPIQAYSFGAGGVVGWGTLCGSLLGAALATSFIADGEHRRIINDVIHWYTTTELPLFAPKQPRSEIQNTSTSDSPLCHASVGSWMAKEGVDIESPQRADRCARLSADVSMKTVTLLNLWVDGEYVPTHEAQGSVHEFPSQNNCGDCHG